MGNISTLFLHASAKSAARWKIYSDIKRISGSTGVYRTPKAFFRGSNYFLVKDFLMALSGGFLKFTLLTPGT